MKLFTTSFCAILLFAGTVSPQVFGDLTIANQQAVGTDFFFDIYLTRTGANDIYLGTADFVLTFNASAFTSPTLVREGSSFWNLTSTSSNPVGASYRGLTSTAPIVGNEIIINLNQVGFGDQSDFDDFVARINNTPNTHRLGRYRVTGITNTSEFMNLQWKTTGTGLTTQIFTFDNVTPWITAAVSINAINPGNTPLPVELTSFTSKVISDRVQLNWQTKTEVNNYGFEIERASLSASSRPVWEKIGFVNGNGNSNSPKDYLFVDKNFIGGSKFNYRLKQIDNDGQFEYSEMVEVQVVPNKFELYQNYPNPFNPSTKIRYQLPNESKVVIKIYNILGSEVMELVNSKKEAGVYEAEFNAASLSSGTYIYKISADNFVQTKKMILLK